LLDLALPDLRQIEPTNPSDISQITPIEKLYSALFREHKFIMKKTFSFVILATSGVLVIGLTPAVAGAATTTTTTFQVTANVQANCVISASPLAFGTYTGAVNNTTAPLTITCTNTTPYNVGFDAGTASGATVSSRSMLNGTAKLNYKISKDSGNTTNWGNTVGTDTTTGTGTGSAQNVTVYGQIPAGQYVTPGSYADTITASIIY
jgi:spore coat protein U-like protein